MVSVASFKSSSIQHDVNFVNYGHIYFKIDNKAVYALGQAREVSSAANSYVLIRGLIHTYSTKRCCPRNQLPVNSLCFKHVFQ